MPQRWHWSCGHSHSQKPLIMRTIIFWASMALLWADAIALAAFKGQVEALIIAPLAIAAAGVMLAAIGGTRHEA